MAERAVAITGLGVVCPGALGAEALWQSLLAGQRSVRIVESFDATAFPCGLGGDLGAFSAKDYVPKSYRKSVKVMARDIEIAVAAADMAFRDSGIVTPGTDGGEPTIQPGELGCNIGAGLICTDLDELGVALTTALDENGKFSLEKWGKGGMNNLTPLWLLKYLPNMLSCHVTIIHQAKGPSNTITCGDASAHLAVGEAARMIARGTAQAAVAGGAESKMNPMGLLRQALLKRLCVSWTGEPGQACRPFDREHCGTAIGEGGGLLILEDAQRARSRGARAYAELAGFAGACDPTGIDVERPNAGSLDLAAARALRDAGIGPDEVDLIITHGTGVPGEDQAEADAWRTALGPAAGTIPAVAVTGGMGSLFAGAGGVELAVAALALHHQIIPPTVNHESPAAGCQMNFLSAARAAEIRNVVTGAFSVGGQSGACVLRRSQS